MFEKCANCGTRVTLGYREKDGIFCSKKCRAFFRHGGFCEKCRAETTDESVEFGPQYGAGPFRASDRLSWSGSRRCPNCNSDVRTKVFCVLLIPVRRYGSYRVIWTSGTSSHFTSRRLRPEADPVPARLRPWNVLGTIAVCLIAAIVFLQIPPYDQWRYHTVLSWRVDPASAAPTSERPVAVSPLIHVHSDVPTRITWSAEGKIVSAAVPSNSVTLTAATDGHPVVPCTLSHGQWTLGCISHALGLGPDMSAIPYLLPEGSSAGKLLLMANRTGSDVDYRLNLTSYQHQPTIIFTVAQPAGYYRGLPLEDVVFAPLLIGLGVLGSSRWLLTRRRSASASTGGLSA